MLPPELYETRHNYPDGKHVTVRIWRELLTDRGRVDIPEGDMDKWTPRYSAQDAEGQAWQRFVSSLCEREMPDHTAGLGIVPLSAYVDYRKIDDAVNGVARAASTIARRMSCPRAIGSFVCLVCRDGTWRRYQDGGLAHRYVVDSDGRTFTRCLYCCHRGTEFEPVFGLVEYHEVPSDITERERARLVEEDTPATEFYDTIMRMRGTR